MCSFGWFSEAFRVGSFITEIVRCHYVQLRLSKLNMDFIRNLESCEAVSFILVSISTWMKSSSIQLQFSYIYSMFLKLCRFMKFIKYFRLYIFFFLVADCYHQSVLLDFKDLTSFYLNAFNDFQNFYTYKILFLQKTFMKNHQTGYFYRNF